MEEKSQQWDFSIEPHGSLLLIKLGKVWRYRDLLRMYVKRDISHIASMPSWAVTASLVVRPFEFAPAVASASVRLIPTAIPCRSR